LRISTKPNNAEFYYKRGTAFINKGDYDRAIADYDQAIRLKPTTSAYGSRALAYSSKGEYDRAIADCDQALKLDPNNDTAYNNRAFASIKKGDYDRALADLDRAIKLEPELVPAYTIRGLVYQAKGNRELATADFSKALSSRAEPLTAMLKRPHANSSLPSTKSNQPLRSPLPYPPSGSCRAMCQRPRRRSRHWRHPRVIMASASRSSSATQPIAPPIR
jgi:tetratricopeptide (TPR) repeat protein